MVTNPYVLNLQARWLPTSCQHWHSRGKIWQHNGKAFPVIFQLGNSYPKKKIKEKLRCLRCSTGEPIFKKTWIWQSSLWRHIWQAGFCWPCLNELCRRTRSGLPTTLAHEFRVGDDPVKALLHILPGPGPLLGELAQHTPQSKGRNSHANWGIH